MGVPSVTPAGKQTIDVRVHSIGTGDSAGVSPGFSGVVFGTSTAIDVPRVTAEGGKILRQ